MNKILIIDDEKDICFLISEILKDEKYLTDIALNSDEALKKFNDKPNLVILDEATSALDEATEEKILYTIYSNIDEKTVVSISHKKSSLKYCDKIYAVKDGSISEL